MPHDMQPAPSSPIETLLPELSTEPMERRRDWRAATVFSIGKISFNGRSLPCMVRDLSEGGMRIQMPFPPPRGTRILIEMRGLDARLARICWISGHEAGLKFDLRCSPADVFAARRNPSGFIARQPRFAFRRDAALRVGDTPIATMVENISVGGARLTRTESLKNGMQGVLDLLQGDGHSVAGEICWLGEDGCGFRFVKPISSVALATMLDSPDVI